MMYIHNMFERCLYFNINVLTRAVNRIWDEAFAKFGLSPSHAYLLRLVLSNPGITPKQISRELNLEKSTISRFLNVLQKDAFIHRKKASTGDAREQGIYPTRKSVNIASQLEEQGNNLYTKMLNSIGSSELKALVENLRKTKNKLS